MIILTEKTEIENAQEDLIRRLLMHCTIPISVKLGHKGETIECTINWSPGLGLWFHSRPIQGSRYWNAFGYSENTPLVNSLLPIICEINPPIEGLNKRTQGAFFRDNDEKLILVHRGKIGGGKPGIGRKLFFDNYNGIISIIDKDRLAIIGELSSHNFVEQVTKFVHEVNRIKKG